MTQGLKAFKRFLHWGPMTAIGKFCYLHGSLVVI